MPNFSKIRSTFGVTPYNPERKDPKAIYEHYQDQISTQPLPEETMPWNVPFPPGQFAQEKFDDMLMRQVVDPLSKAGFQDLGAGLASIPSAAHSMLVPQTEFDLAATIIPLPGIAKAMKKGKYRKIRNAMKAEDPENVGKIIAEQASKVSDTGEKIYASPDELKKIQDEGDPFKQMKPKAEVRAIDEKEMLRKADESNARDERIKNSLSKISDLMNELKKLSPEKSTKSFADSLTKGGWYDKIGGKKGFESKFAEFRRDNPGHHVLHEAIEDYLKAKERVTNYPHLYDRVVETDAYNKLVDTIDKERGNIKFPDSLKWENPEKEEITNQIFGKPKTPLKSVEPPKVTEPPKGPKGDPEAFLRPQEPQQFSRIRQAIDPQIDEKSIKKKIAEKYGIDGDYWSAVDSEADPEFGVSDLSGRKGNLYRITDGDIELEVTEDEYLDIVGGLSGGIPIEDTPFFKTMNIKKSDTEF